MENVKAKEFVLKISGLWNEQKKREALYLAALRKDSMGSMRKMLSQGHFSALLFQKEIRGIYDYFKCLFTDKELGELDQTGGNYAHLILVVEEKDQIMEILSKNEAATRQYYKAIFKYLDDDSEIHRILYAQLDRISEFYEILSNHEVLNLESVN